MGKQGPCYHCGVTNTPLWRNGPPEKPVLCNACGSRWRTKGTLVNYIPLHCRAEADDHEDHKFPKTKTISLTKRNEMLKKRKLSYENTSFGRCASDYSQGYQKSMDEDTSNRSSSGSAVSNYESCAQLSADASDLTGPAQSVVWEGQVPSKKKRTLIPRTKQSSVEKLTQDLYAILQEQQNSNLSGSYEEELLFESDKPMVSVEIGHGSVLMKHPSSLVKEEESEASSLSVEVKPPAVNEAYSKSVPLFGSTDNMADNSLYHRSGICKKANCQMVKQEPGTRDRPIQDRMQLIWNHKSPLCDIDLNDVINFEVLLGHLTNQEQQKLLKYLPLPDTSQLPGSLRSMFSSSSFKENLSAFQQLLSKGVFGNYSSGVKGEDFITLKRLAVSNLAKSKWLALYNKLKGSKLIKDAGERQDAFEATPSLSKSQGSTRSHEELNQLTPGRNTTIKSPRKVLMKAKFTTKETPNNYGSCITPKSLFAQPIEDQHLMMESHGFGNESTDQSDEDLLIDIPSNGFFPQAELLPVSSLASLKRSAESSPLNPYSTYP